MPNTYAPFSERYIRNNMIDIMSRVKCNICGLMVNEEHIKYHKVMHEKGRISKNTVNHKYPSNPFSDAGKKGGRKKGDGRMFDDEQVADIRSRFERGTKMKKIAYKYNTSYSMIYNIINKRGAYK